MHYCRRLPLSGGGPRWGVAVPPSKDTALSEAAATVHRATASPPPYISCESSSIRKEERPSASSESLQVVVTEEKKIWWIYMKPILSLIPCMHTTNRSILGIDTATLTHFSCLKWDIRDESEHRPAQVIAQQSKLRKIRYDVQLRHTLDFRARWGVAGDAVVGATKFRRWLGASCYCHSKESHNVQNVMICFWWFLILWILVYFYSTFYVKWVIFEAQNLEDKIPSLDCLREGKKDIVVFEKWATHETHISSTKSTEHCTVCLELMNGGILGIQH